MVKNRVEYQFSWLDESGESNSLASHDLWGAGINSTLSGFDNPWDFTQLGGFLEYFVPLPTALPAPPHQYYLAQLPFSVGGTSNIYGFQSSANLEHAAVWFQVSPAPTQPITRTVLKVTQMNTAGSSGPIAWGPYSTKSVEALTFTIPATTAAPPIPLQPVTSTVRKLLPSFFYNPSSLNQFTETETVSLLPLEIEQVISDQIAGNDANKLPTAYFKGEANNPMLLATRSGQKANLRVEMACASDPKIFVGARKNGTQNVLGYASVTAAVVPLEIDVPANSHDIYEIVSGYDFNGNSKLDDAEVVTTFRKTPLKDASGANVTDPQNLLDRVIIVDGGQFGSSKSTCLGYNVFGSEYAGDLIQAFAKGQNTVPNSVVTPSITISSTQSGLSHPVGAKWNTSNLDTTYRFTFADGSPASNDTEGSNALNEIVQKVINDNKAAMISAYTGAHEWPVSPFYQFSEDKNFMTTDPDPIGINELGNAFGKVTIQGQLRISYKKTNASTIQVGSVELIGAFDDLYDFAYGGGDRAKQAAMVQAGHATHGGTTEPNSGKFFFTRVEFHSGWANTWNGSY